MKFYTTGTAGVQNTSAHIGKATQIFCLPIGVRKAGDIVDIDADEEVTINTDYDAWVWCEIFISTDPAAVTTLDSAHQAAGRNGTNVLAEQHHAVFAKSGKVRVPSNGTYWAIMAITWSADSENDGTLEGKGYGMMTAMVFETGIDF